VLKDSFRRRPSAGSFNGPEEAGGAAEHRTVAIPSAWIATYNAWGAPPTAPRSHSAFAFRRANRPWNHAFQKAVAQDQRVKQYRTHVGKKGQEQKIREDRVRLA
jgi:hypothetical protein